MTRSLAGVLFVALAASGVWFTSSALAADPAPAATTAAPAAVPTLATYTLDPVKSSLYVQVYKDPTTLASGLSHDHVIAATGWSGKVTWDTANVGACKISITVPTSGLVNDESSLRSKVGYTTTLDDGDRAEVKEHMLGADQLASSSYPSITFASTGCSAPGTVSGTMSMHGVGKAVSAPFTITADATNFTAKGTWKVKLSDFGVQPFSALFGQLKNLDEVKFTIDARGSVK